jgi:hypothetical protein
MSDELEKVECLVIDETEKAYQLQEATGEKRTEWFPKSHVSFSRRNVKTQEAVAEIPLWLLKAKGWDS